MTTNPSDQSQYRGIYGIPATPTQVSIRHPQARSTAASASSVSTPNAYDATVVAVVRSMVIVILQELENHTYRDVTYPAIGDAGGVDAALAAIRSSEPSR